MNFIKKHKGKIIAAVCITVVLAVAFFYGGKNQSATTDNSINDKTAIVSQLQNEPVSTPEIQTETQKPTGTPEAEQSQPVIEEATLSAVPETTQKENIEYSEESGMTIDEKTGMDEHNTEPVPVGKPVPVEPEKAEVTTNELTCTLSIRCDNAVGKSSEKAVVIPDDGVIFAEQTVVFYEGESVFNVLVREMKKNKIHLEFVNTPIYNSAYIEGINNLYEYDCGELSGWMYKVNGWYPNYGCSRYELKNGDKIEWVYTCDLGKDVGGDYSARNGMQNE